MKDKELDIIESKIESIDKVSQSQLDRITQKDELDKDLFNFCKEKIKESIKNNPTKEKAMEILDRKMDKEDDLSLNQVLSIIELFDKNDNELALGLLKLATEKEKTNTQILIQNNKNGEDDSNSKKDEPLTKDDVDEAKNSIKKIDEFLELKEMLSDVKKNEFNDSEK